MAGWDDYFKGKPVLCTPLAPMKAIASALAERYGALYRYAQYSEYTNPDNVLYQILHNYDGDYNDTVMTDVEDIQVYGGDSYSFYTFTDEYIENLIKNDLSYCYTKPDGTLYTSLNDLAISATGSSLIKAGYYDGSSYTFTNLLDADWLQQRMNMINALVYVTYDCIESETGCKITYHNNDAGSYEDREGNTKQQAYNNHLAWYKSGGYSPDVASRFDSDLEDRVRIQYFSDTNKFYVENFCEITKIEPNLSPDSSIVVPSNTKLIISAGLPEPYDSASYPNVIQFNSMCCGGISSGVNELPLNNGVFASWGYGTATLNNTQNPVNGTYYIEGWSVKNAKVICDYSTEFEFVTPEPE